MHVRPLHPYRGVRLATVLVALTFAGYGLMAAPAALAVDPPPRSDQFNTGSWYDTPRANEELKKWRQRAGASDDFRTQTQDCLSILDDVATHERESQRFHKLAADNRGNGPVWRRYHELAGAQSQLAARFVVKFWQECVNARFRPPESPGDQFNTGGTPRPIVPPGNVPSVGGTRPPPTTPRPPLQGTAERHERICDLQRLAAWVFRRYGNRSRGPVARVKVANAPRPTYVLLLSGMEWDRRGQATLAGDALIAWANIQALNAYRWAIMDAVADLDPRTTDLILVGHSQGGMEAQTVVENLVGRWGYRIPQVITYGAPIVTERHRGTGYLHVRAPDDPLIGLDRRFDFSSTEILFSNRRTPDPHKSYWTDASGLSLYRVPSVSTLRTPCFELDLTTLEEFSAPNLFERFFGPTPDPRRATTPLNPGWPRSPIADPVVNCFWVAMAQDQAWEHGLRVPARCEARTVRTSEIPPQLSVRYGGRNVDDLHGPTPADSLHRHTIGEPVRSSRQQIESTLPPGGRGIVFVRLPDPHNPSEVDPRQGGHVFNVRRLANGDFEYRDAQTGQNPTFWFNTPDLHVFFYRTR